MGVVGRPGVALGSKWVSWVLWNCRGRSVVPGFRLQEHGRGHWIQVGMFGGPWIQVGLQEGCWGPCGMQGDLWRVWPCWDCREMHCVLWGSRGPKGDTKEITVCFRGAGERLGVSEHFASGEEGALRVQNHCRDGGEEGSWTRGEVFLECLGSDCRRWGSLVMLGGVGEAWGSQIEVGLQEGCGGPECRGDSGRGWPCWGCRRGPAPSGGHTAAPAHLQPLLFGHLPLVLLIRLVPDEDFLDTIGCVLGGGTV